MGCSQKNILINGGFWRRLFPWQGHNIQWVDNPVKSGDHSVIMGLSPRVSSVLKRVRQVPLESKCAYYLYFQILNVSPENIQAKLFATVSYMDQNRKIIRSTPLLILPARSTVKRFRPYFTIVPPPPLNTREISVAFLLQQGTVYVDYIRLASHQV